MLDSGASLMKSARLSYSLSIDDSTSEYATYFLSFDPNITSTLKQPLL